MSNLKIYIIGLLIFGNLALALGIVWVEHLNRAQYRKLQEFSNQKYELRNDWKKVRIEEGIYASHSRIENKAQNLLNMSPPKKRKLITLND